MAYVRMVHPNISNTHNTNGAPTPATSCVLRACCKVVSLRVSAPSHVEESKMLDKQHRYTGWCVGWVF